MVGIDPGNTNEEDMARAVRAVLAAYKGHPNTYAVRQRMRAAVLRVVDRYGKPGLSTLVTVLLDVGPGKFAVRVERRVPGVKKARPPAEVVDLRRHIHGSMRAECSRCFGDGRSPFSEGLACGWCDGTGIEPL